MNKYIPMALTLLIISGLVYVLNILNPVKPFELANDKSKADNSEILITNQDTVDVTVYLTLGVINCKYDTTIKNGQKIITKNCTDSLKWEQDVYGIFGSNIHGSKYIFKLKPKDTLRYSPLKGIQGNISFITDAWQCSPDSSSTGSNIIEFCLNNNGTVLNAQETIEISCVSGVTYIGRVDFYNGGIWTANYKGYDTITTVENGDFGHNTGRVGVYPVGCDDCNSITNPPSCTIPNGYHESPQKYAICNVQRNAKNSGGKVVFSFIRPALMIATK